jgi:hypothetical protein
MHIYAETFTSFLRKCYLGRPTVNRDDYEINIPTSRPILLGILIGKTSVSFPPLTKVTGVMAPVQPVQLQPTTRPPPLFAKLLRLDNPIRSLTLAFWSWKVLLYIVVAACPGSGYDTSTSLISYAADQSIVAQSNSLSGPLKFARWDSIYFLDIAEKGYLFEQEWAFGWGYTKLLSIFVSGTQFPLLLYPYCAFLTRTNTVNRYSSFWRRCWTR